MCGHNVWGGAVHNVWGEGSAQCVWGGHCTVYGGGAVHNVCGGGSAQCVDTMCVWGAVHNVWTLECFP
jgi:hypothetical protein